jgi:hypothetical protein
MLGVVGLPDEAMQPAFFYVWPENGEAVKVFLACDDQWRTRGEAFIGLDLAVVFQVMDLYNVKDRRMVLEDVRVIAARACALLNS